MYIRINLPAGTKISPTKIKFFARLNLLSYKFNTADRILNDFLIKDRKKSLLSICLQLINNINLSMGDDNNYIGSFYKKDDVNLAAMITYGNSEIHGSAILTNVFNI